ncbi:MAG TPA: SDR family oxidoreductase [Conexibacter sp.]|jgi:NAD(P)-dependent dehydrogenase (short-subunit alcohol dehydrogenase family)
MTRPTFPAPSGSAAPTSDASAVGAATPTLAAIVTGGARGIGFAIARMLAEEGYALTLSARRPDSLEQAAEELRALGVPVATHAANLAERGVADALASAHLAAHGRLDVLVNSAGVGATRPIEEMSDKLIDLQLDVNLRALFALHRTTAPLLRAAAAERGSALVVNLASITAARPEPHQSVYAATKAAVIAFTHAMNQELGPDGVRCTAISPGYVRSEMTAFLHGRVAPQEMIAPEDVAGAVRWLLGASPACVVAELPITRPGGVT